MKGNKLFFELLVWKVLFDSQNLTISFGKISVAASKPPNSRVILHLSYIMTQVFFSAGQKLIDPFQHQISPNTTYDPFLRSCHLKCALHVKGHGRSKSYWCVVNKLKCPCATSEADSSYLARHSSLARWSHSWQGTGNLACEGTH